MKTLRLLVILTVTCLIFFAGVVHCKQRQYNENLTKDLVNAVLNKNVENAKSLLGRNANPNATDSEGTPLLMAVLLRMEVSANEAVAGKMSGDKRQSETAQIVKLLLDAGANPNAINKEGNPVLLAAFMRQDPNVVADLIRAGASVKGTDASGSPLIVSAAFSGNQKIIELMVNAGANVNEQDKKGTTPLLVATYKQNWELSKFLIQKGANVNAHVDVGTPLLFAAAAGHFETVKLLVEKGADINSKDNKNNSPLSIAIARQHQKIIDFLKTAGAK